MLAYLYRTGATEAEPDEGGMTTDQKAFHRAADLLTVAMHSPATQATIFEAVGRIPGVTAVQNATDAAGRSGIAVAMMVDPARPVKQPAPASNGPQSRVYRENRRVLRWALIEY